MARSDHHPPSSVHGLAPELRRLRRRGGTRAPPPAPVGGAGGVLPRGRGGRPRTRRAQRSPAADPALGSGSRSCWPCSAWRVRSGSGSRGCSWSRSPWRPLWSRAPSSSSPTTWSCSADASTATSGSRPPGDRLPALTSYWANALAIRLGGRGGLGRRGRPSGASGSASLSAGSRPRSASFVAGRSRSAACNCSADGSTRKLTPARIAAPLDAALRAISASLVLLAVALVVVRV